MVRLPGPVVIVGLLLDDLGQCAVERENLALHALHQRVLLDQLGVQVLRVGEKVSSLEVLRRVREQYESA